MKSQELQHLPVSVQRVGSRSQRAECFLTLSFVWSLGSPPGNAAAELCSLPALLTPFHSPNTGPDPIPLHTEQVRSDCKAHWMRIEFTVPVFSIKELEGLAAIHAALGLWEDVFQPSRAIQFGKTRSSPIPKCWNFILSSHFPHPAQNSWYPRVQLPV